MTVVFLDFPVPYRWLAAALAQLGRPATKLGRFEARVVAMTRDQLHRDASFRMLHHGTP
jgi:hypothetical protein